MLEIFESVMGAWPTILPWLPGCAWGLFCYLVGRTMKYGPLSADRARQVRWVRLVRKWFPLPLHPLAASLLPATVWGETPFGTAFGEKLLYFIAFAVIAVLWHDILNQFEKWRGLKSEDES